MEMKVSIGKGYFSVTDVSLSTKEVVAEIEHRLGTEGVELREGKAVRWVANPYYDDFAEHSHDSPGRFELVTDDPEKLELLRAVRCVCAALKNNSSINQKND